MSNIIGIGPAWFLCEFLLFLLSFSIRVGGVLWARRKQRTQWQASMLWTTLPSIILKSQSKDILTSVALFSVVSQRIFSFSTNTIIFQVKVAMGGPVVPLYEIMFEYFKPLAVMFGYTRMNVSFHWGWLSLPCKLKKAFPNSRTLMAGM